MVNKIKLSIVIPMYNAELYIKSCINSCYKQNIEEHEFEIIVVNDGSTDNGLKILTELAVIHSNIIVINQSNSGVSVARNRGIDTAQGNFLLFLDADDLLVSDSMPAMIETAERLNIDILKAELIKLNNQNIENYTKEKQFIYPDSYQCMDGETAFINYYDPLSGYSCCNLYRTKFLKENNLHFLQKISFVEDVAFTIKACLSAKRVIVLPYKFYLYRQYSTSTMATMSVDKLLSANRVQLYLFNLLSQTSYSSGCKQKLHDCIYASMSVIFWYLSHYKSLYPHRNKVISDLKTKIPHITFKHGYSQHIFGFCYHYCPSFYISIRYCFARKKY